MAKKESKEYGMADGKPPNIYRQIKKDLLTGYATHNQSISP
jgi:hypothetical protein